MRIGLFIDTQNYGGAEAVVVSLCVYLQRFGHEPVLYQYKNDYLQKASAELGIECREVSHWRAYKRTYRLPWFAYHFRRLLRADRIDMLHSHLFGPIIAGGLAGRLAGIPHVGTLHDVYIVQERPLRAKLLRLVFSIGTDLVCVSQDMAEYYAAVTHIALADLHVIPNGVELGRFIPREPGSRRPDDGIVLIAVGRLDPIKRHDLMFEALAGLKENARCRLKIVGDGPERESLQARAEELGIGSRVEFLGQRNDIPDQLSSADVFLLVSDSEGMSLSLIEALACGLPVIATHVGNNEALIKAKESGILIAPGSRTELEAAISRLSADADYREALGRNARATAMELDLDETMGAYVELYREATDAGA